MDPQSNENLVNQSASQNMPENMLRAQKVGDPMKPKIPIKLLGILLASLFVLIVGGLFLASRGTSPDTSALPTPTPTKIPNPTPTKPPTNNTQVPQIQFLPGKQYYNDTLSIITQDNPHQAMTVSATRVEQESNFLQYTTINYFDGTTWKENTVTNTNQNNAVANNIIIRNWSNNATDPASKEVSFTVSISNTQIQLSTNAFQGEISLVSLPEYTKFVSQGKGTILINNKEHDAYFTYTRAYSVNASTLGYLNTPGTLDSRWLTAWDENGQFYVIDILTSNRRTTQYRNYRVGAMQDEKSTVQRASSVEVSQNREDTGKYTATLNTLNLNIAYITSNRKEGANDQFSWRVGTIDGNVVVPTNSFGEKQSLFILGFLEDIRTHE